MKRYQKYDEREEKKSKGAGSAEVQAEDNHMHRHSLNRRPVGAPRQADSMNARLQNAPIYATTAKIYMHFSSELLLESKQIAWRNAVKRN